MKRSTPQGSGLPPDSEIGFRWFWLVIMVCALVLLIGLLRTHSHHEQTGDSGSTGSAGVKTSGDSRPGASIASRLRSGLAAAPEAKPEEIVASKLTHFGRSRRELAHALARRFGVEVPGDVERFFDAVESGNWEAIEARFKAINGGDSSAGHAAERRPEVARLWAAIIDAYGVAEQTHLWPAQKLLDYGNAILTSLRPGMVYVGGTDNGRWIPELLNDTSEGERHIVITQNGLADGTYLDYLRILYGDRLATLTEEDSQRAFQEYLSDAQKRLQHDERFPEEPKRIRPGEDVKTTEGRFQVSGQVAVMAINEKLLETLMQKNPDLSFALQESFPLKGTYAEAAPLGPIMELRAESGQGAFTAERAAQSLDYWRATTQELLLDPAATGSEETLKAYSHDVTAAANLLASHNFNTEAEQAYRLSSQIAPSNPEAVTGLAEVLARAGRFEEARQVLETFEQRYPEQRSAVEALRGSVIFTTREGTR